MKAPTFSSGHPHPRPSSSKIETRGQPGQWPLPGQSPCSLVFVFIYNCRHRAVQQVPTGTALRRPSRAPIEKCYGEEREAEGAHQDPGAAGLPEAASTRRPPQPTPPWAPHAAAKNGVTADGDKTTTDLTVSLRTQEAAGSFHLGQGGGQPTCEMNKLVLQQAAVPGSREAKLLFLSAAIMNQQGPQTETQCRISSQCLPTFPARQISKKESSSKPTSSGAERCERFPSSQSWGPLLSACKGQGRILKSWPLGTQEVNISFTGTSQLISSSRKKFLPTSHANVIRPISDATCNKSIS